MNKNVDIKGVEPPYSALLMRTTPFWINLHQIGLKSKDWKAK